ncbi:MAG: c-type cytochrome domain-containing protein [Isosphaeraceae bacterium]
MRLLKICTLVTLACCPVAARGAADQTKPTPLAVNVPKRTEPVSYAKDVADVLAAKCVGCHSEALAENKLNLEEVASMLKGGKRGPALVPGKADQSLLFQMAAHRVDPVMPPKDKKDAKPLTADELGLLKLWIDSGAKDDSAENAEPEKPIELGELPPGVHPVVALDMTSDGTKVAAGRANVVQVIDVDSGLEIVTLGGHKDIVQSVRYSPDGRRLAAGSYQIVTVWNAPKGGLEATMAGHTDKVTAVARSFEPGWFASASLDRTIRTWNDATGKPIHTYTTPSPILSMGATVELALVAVGCQDGAIRCFDVSNGGQIKEIATLKGHKGPVESVAVFSKGAKGQYGILSASSDGSVKVWEFPSRAGEKPAEPKTLEGPKGPMHAAAVSADGAVLAAAGDDGKVYLWNAADLKPLRVIEAHSAPVLALAFGHDVGQILTGSADKTAKLYDYATGTLKHTLKTHTGAVNAVGFSLKDQEIFTGGAEGGVKVWDRATGQGVIAFGHTAPNNGPIQPVTRLLMLQTGGIVSASADKTLKLWKYEGRWSEHKILGPHAFRVLALDFNPDGTLLAAGGGEPSRSGEIKVWETGKGMIVRTLDGLHSDTVFGLRFSPDGSKLASCGADRFMKVTRVSDGKELRAFEGHTHHVMAVDWKVDGKQIVTGGADNVLKFWDAESGEQVRTTQPAGKQVTSIRWVPGKSNVAGASGDRSVRIWSADSGGVLRTFSGPNDYVFAVSASSDGSRVAAGDAEGAVFVWNGLTTNLIRKIEPPQAAGASKPPAAK